MGSLDIFTQGLRASLRKPSSVFATAMVLIVPLMYPLFWLQAFWNPYANVGSLPVAFVNEDDGALGAGLKKQLQASTDVKWVLTDRSTADGGLKGKTYYAEFIVPKDFSQKIASAQTASIEVHVSSKNNFIASLLASQIEKRLEERLSRQIAEDAAQRALGNAAVAAFIANPVDGVLVDVNPVANSGTGFAPYFSSLALWIGALLISLGIGRKFDPEQLRAASGVEATAGCYMLFACAGIVQAALLTAVLYLHGIEVRSGWLTFAALVVSSLTSIAIVSSLVGIFGMLGQMLSMLILIFQLTASGGTFPTELTQGGFFKALHPFVPFTYSVNALRESISGVPVDLGIFANSLAVQLAVAAAVLVACALVTGIRKGGSPAD